MITESASQILITGANGFIGRRLLTALLQRGYHVRCMVRRQTELPEGATQTVGDLLQPETLPEIFKGVSVAYYLVHSMGAGKIDFAIQDR